MASAADVKRIAREFAALDDTAIDPFIADAAAEVCSTTYGAKGDRVIVLLAAHALAIAYPELYKGAGRVQSETVGGVSRTYAVASFGGAPLSTTRFGAEAMRLQRQVLTLPFAI